MNHCLFNNRHIETGHYMLLDISAKDEKIYTFDISGIRRLPIFGDPLLWAFPPDHHP